MILQVGVRLITSDDAMTLPIPTDATGFDLSPGINAQAGLRRVYLFENYLFNISNF